MSGLAATKEAQKASRDANRFIVIEGQEDERSGVSFECGNESLHNFGRQFATVAHGIASVHLRHRHDGILMERVIRSASSLRIIIDQK